MKDSLTQRWEERDFKQREDYEKSCQNANPKHQEKFYCASQMPAGNNSLQMFLVKAGKCKDHA